MDRYARQRRLPEVGDTGQARLAECELLVAGSGAAARVEREYLVRAGVPRVAEAPERTPEPFVHARLFEHAAARALAAGAWRALAQIRREIGLGRS